MAPRSPRCVRTPTLMTIPENECCSSRLFLQSTEDAAGFLNNERKRRRLPTLEQHPHLDLCAQLHAMQMANAIDVFHSVGTIEELKQRLGSEAVGENVQRGDSIFSMLCETMESGSTINKSNMLSEHFTQFGSATVTGRDGKVYFCQVFRGAPTS